MGFVCPRKWKHPRSDFNIKAITQLRLDEMREQESFAVGSNVLPVSMLTSLLRP